ncbi:alpha/beta hydrolase [Sporosarcina newyorkensis 2681]|uniref:Alpha/beta hydrolase n=1 Tax=Sporosarcina newyorkensis 2681 TaxID=1027292 RepID=F9DMK7_9BACL|nr:alpha/beta hydrolase [Sporosarcina newyorkensis 2681]
MEINGVEHEIMIRGANKDNPVMILVHADLDHLKRRTLFNMKIYWKQILLW